ncbi:MAG: FAD-dependent oxidoreductase [Acidobacteriia bacterium]|nr:FAD-dependent oxidoreductase [Terriglobia bacterium]
MAVVIIGGGQGGFQTAASLRAEGYQERITLIGDEPGVPYQRPPLSKGFLLGKQEQRHAELRPAAFYETQRIDLLTGRVTAIDRVARRVKLDSGEQIEYDTLVLATGARNRPLPHEGVFYLRTLPEATEIRQRLAAAQDVVVIGGGFIGLEVAAAARTLGKQVTVVEGQPRLMARVVAPVVSEYFRGQHEAKGVDILLNAVLLGISEKEVLLEERTRRPADLVIAGIGVVPNVELAREAGLPVGNGITVDEYLRTPDERIFAIGDCAESPSMFAEDLCRLESVQNAVDQAACVAKANVGHRAPYGAVPWFWTDQYDIHLQMAGLPTGFDQVVTRGDPESRKFSVFYFRGGKLCAVDSVNRPADHLAARKLIGAHATVSPDQAKDESFDLKVSRAE